MSAPALAAARCLSSIRARRIRASLLHEAGDLDPGTENMVVTDGVILVGITPNIQAGDSFTQKNGSGTVCVYITDDDTILRYDLTMNLCTLDFELKQLLLGGRVIQQGGVTVGYADRGLTDVPPKVCFEAWADAVAGSEQASEDGLSLYIHHVFPLTRWTIGGSQMENQPYVTAMTGKATPNASMGLGPNAEWPEVITETHAEFLDDAIPDSVCGYQALVVAGSAS
jgi:hypothetical protein